ncbi:4603_t:CDS:2, partial [Paraglomus occultum]
KYYMDESSSNSDDKADSAFLRVASMVNRDAKEIHRIDENDSESSFLKDSVNATEVIKSSEVETRTLVTLKAKMEELREQLEHEHDIGNINELCQSIQSCVATLGTIEELIFKRHLA